MNSTFENKPFQLKTERLLVNALQLSDAAAIFGARNNPKINTFLPWKPKAVEEVEEWIRKAAAIPPNTEGNWHLLGIRLRESEILVGDIGIHFLPPHNQQAEIGYMVLEAHQGKGYASEAIKAVLNFLFGTYQKHRVTAAVDPDNEASVRLLRRLGMRQEAHHLKSYWMDGRWTDDMIFAILQEEWEQQLNLSPHGIK